MNFIDKEHVALFEVGEQRGEVAGLGDYRTGSGAETDTKLPRNDLRQRRLAEARRPDEQHVIERFAAAASSFDEYAEIFAGLLLPDEFGQPQRPQRTFRRVFLAAFGSDQFLRD